MIRVVIVDDEALVRTGFTMILNATDDIRVVGTASGIEALDVIKAEKPDVLLLDIRMPQIDGLTLLGIISTLPERPAVAMLTTFDADEYIMTALGSGASGFLLKDTEPEQLGQYVRALAAGGVVLSRRASRTLLDTHPGLGAALDEEAERVSTLTDRERQVLTLVAEGLSNADIGARLYLGAGTVKDHVSAILAKLGVTSRVQAALAAQRAGVLDERRPGR
ncbi:Transcriptional regulatory protein DevR (DosR) [Microbacterium azadirachtae]|uniref:Transcriptional regulatory protein DevR (DosR) n=1 Tax=Microbacterium azadirachtae TaxID=582680 RepID=A0A0F0LM80_9MICO|nr:response regulator transcription factor [Microbacterium azadirachtae]KJL33789.1 Transcriptional regulatory protein DevR (DosR) [Microbacterium azadirachtae]